MPARPEDEITVPECEAMRILEKGAYSVTELAFIFECQEPTVRQHLDGDCPHDSLDNNGPVEARQSYSDGQLLTAYRIVYQRQPYEEMSSKVYDEYRPSDFPCDETIHDRFGSWVKAREKVHGE